MEKNVVSARDRLNGAFYTPTRIARIMARQLSVTPPAIVIDPACGRGDLLTAVAREAGTEGIHLVGIDKDSKALLACEASLQAMGADFTLLRSNFFDCNLNEFLTANRSVYITMNPPFKGYGNLSRANRARLRRTIPGLYGRYNMAHVFLEQLIVGTSPKALVALLPGNWGKAAYNDLRDLLGLPGNSWRGVREPGFDDATTTVGVLVLRNLGRRIDRARGRGRGIRSAARTMRQGVATGADEVFFRLAEMRPSIGTIAPAARGREVANGVPIADLPRIWIPPQEDAARITAAFRGLPDSLRTKLTDRYCVRILHRDLWSFHEQGPEWFLGTSKLLLPEVCVKMSILRDGAGRIFPLHSTIAVKMSSPREGRDLESLLMSDKSWKWLRARCPSMVGGAIRLTVPILGELLKTRLRRTRM